VTDGAGLRHSGPVRLQLQAYNSLHGFVFPTFFLLPIHPSIHLIDPKSHTKPTITDTQIEVSLETSTIMSHMRDPGDNKPTDGYSSGRNIERDRMRILLKDNDVEEQKEHKKKPEDPKKPEGQKSEGRSPHTCKDS
jgi:hypothetical protein